MRAPIAVQVLLAQTALPLSFNSHNTSELLSAEVKRYQSTILGTLGHWSTHINGSGVMPNMSHCQITHSTRIARHVGIIKPNPNPTTNPNPKTLTFIITLTVTEEININ